MSNKQIIFADRLVNASVHNGLVRLDLGVFAAAVQDKVLKELAAIEQRRRDAAASGSAAGEAGA